MVEVKDGKACDTGPRSAHIAGLDYEVFTDADKIQNPRLVPVSPMPGDPEYASIECDNGVRVCLTMSGAANIAGYVKPGDYAYGNVEAARKVLGFAAAKNSRVAAQLMKDYHMDPQHTVFVGGGGGAASVVPHLAETMHHKSRLAKNGPVISTIGVALAMVRDMVERSVSNPTDNDIISVRREAEQKAIRNGAAPGSVEVTVEVDTQRNVIRAIAVGATELRSKNRSAEKLTEDKLLELAAENLSMDPKALHIAARSENMCAVTADKVEKKLFGLMKKTSHPLRLIDEEGVIRLQKANATVRQADISSWRDAVAYMLEELTVYNDGGTNYPNVYIVLGKRIIDLSGMSSEEQIYSLANVELNGYDAKTPVIVAATLRIDS